MNYEEYEEYKAFPKLTEDVINQIKDFPKNEYKFTKEQFSLIDELIPNEKLRDLYMRFKLCDECGQIDTDYWCRPCYSNRFRREFNNWTSGDKKVDEFIQQCQLNATRPEDMLEWVPYERFEDVEYLAEGGFGIVYKAKWIDGHMWKWDIEQNKWKRLKP